MSDFKIKDYDVHTLPNDAFSMILFGARRQGKTHLLSHLLYTLTQKRKYDVCFLFSETGTVQDAYEYISDYYKYDSLREDIIEKIFKRQEKIKEHNNKVEEIDQKNLPSVLIIADDVINDKSLFACIF